MKRLDTKVALVTGGGSGIGEAICVRFSEEGATVIVSDINLEAAIMVKDKIVESGGNACAKQQNVTDSDRWNTLIDETINEYGKLDILVNNAGIAVIADVENETAESWDKTLSVNLDSVFMGTQAAIKVMKIEGGSIINVSSIEGITGDQLLPAYNASKGGVRIFTKSAALHCAEKDYPIRINSMHPGYIQTPMVANAVDTMGKERGKIFSQRILGAIPMKRLGTPREIANGCLFLASDESSYMTGSELVIDGGYTAR